MVLFRVHDNCRIHIPRCAADGQTVIPLTKQRKSPAWRGNGVLLGYASQVYHYVHHDKLLFRVHDNFVTLQIG